MSNCNYDNFILLWRVVINNPVRELGDKTTSCSWAEQLVCEGELAYTRNRTRYLSTKSTPETQLF